MSMIDAFVSDLSEDDLIPIDDPSAVDGPAQIGEQFMFALALEGKNPNTAAFTERLFFQVNPEEFSFTQTRAIGTYDIINGPQATQLGSMQVRTFTLSSFFPALYEDDYCIPYPAAVLDRTPQQAITWLQLAQTAGYPLQFMSLPLRGAPAIFGNVKIIISSVNMSYRAGNPMDVFFDLEMTELREPTIIRTATTTVAGPAWKTNAAGQHKHVTARGDSLIDVARKYYGSAYGGLWKQIFDANKVVFYPKGVKHSLRQANGKKASNGSQNLLPGQHLNIPRPKSGPR
jgi:nucleoid-associated protein YgaU